MSDKTVKVSNKTIKVVVQLVEYRLLKITDTGVAVHSYFVIEDKRTNLLGETYWSQGSNDIRVSSREYTLFEELERRVDNK